MSGFPAGIDTGNPPAGVSIVHETMIVEGEGGRAAFPQQVQDLTMKRIVSTIDFLAQFIIVASMALMLVIICIQIFFRFGLNSALPWPEEAVRFLMCWSLFLAAVYAQNEQSHLSLNVFVQRLPRNGGLIVRIFMNALIVVFFAGNAQRRAFGSDDADEPENGGTQDFERDSLCCNSRNCHSHGCRHPAPHRCGYQEGDKQMTLFILVALFIVLIAAGMPIAFAIGVASFGALLSQGLPVAIISHYMFAGVDSFVLCAIPMFILAGEIMLQGGLTKALTDLADVLVGPHSRGGSATRTSWPASFLPALRDPRQRIPRRSGPS